MFTDEHRSEVWDQIRQYDLRAFAKLLTPEVLLEAAQRASVKVSKGPLHVLNLVWLGIASALHDSKSLADVLVLTLKLISDTEGFASTPVDKVQKNGRRRRIRKKRSRHDPRRHDPTQLTEESFCKARRHMPWRYWLALMVVLVERFEAAHGECVRWKGFRLLALDGR